MALTGHERTLIQELAVIPWELEAIASLADATSFRFYDCYAAEVGEPHIRISFRNPDGMTWHIHKSNDEFYFLRIFVECHRKLEVLSDDQFASTYAAYVRNYRRLVEGVSQLLGPPIYSGRSGEVGFPEDYLAVEVARWKIAHGHLMVSQEEFHKRADSLILAIVLTPSVTERSQE